MRTKNLNKIIFGLLIIFLMSCCATIAELPKKEKLLDGTDPATLVKNEKVLFTYANSLFVWLIETKKEVNKNWPKESYPNFDVIDNEKVAEKGMDGVKARILYYANYIDKQEPIAKAVYDKFGKVWGDK